FADLRHEPELVGLAELALADRPGVRVEDRHDTVGDPLAAHPLLDLLGDPPPPRDEDLESVDLSQLGLGAPPASASPRDHRQPLRLADRALHELARLCGELEHLLLAFPRPASQRP